MTREQAAALWTCFCDGQGRDISLEAVSEFIAGVDAAAWRRAAAFVERNAACECCARMAEGLAELGRADAGGHLKRDAMAGEG